MFKLWKQVINVLVVFPCLIIWSLKYSNIREYPWHGQKGIISLHAESTLSLRTRCRESKVSYFQNPLKHCGLWKSCLSIPSSYGTDLIETTTAFYQEHLKTYFISQPLHVYKITNPVCFALPSRSFNKCWVLLKERFFQLRVKKSWCGNIRGQWNYRFCRCRVGWLCRLFLSQIPT